VPCRIQEDEKMTEDQKNTWIGGAGLFVAVIVLLKLFGCTGGSSSSSMSKYTVLASENPIFQNGIHDVYLVDDAFWVPAGPAQGAKALYDLISKDNPDWFRTIDGELVRRNDWIQPVFSENAEVNGYPAQTKKFAGSGEYVDCVQTDVDSRNWKNQEQFDTLAISSGTVCFSKDKTDVLLMQRRKVGQDVSGAFDQSTALSACKYIDPGFAPFSCIIEDNKAAPAIQMLKISL